KKNLHGARRRRLRKFVEELGLERSFDAAHHFAPGNDRAARSREVAEDARAGGVSAVAVDLQSFRIDRADNDILRGLGPPLSEHDATVRLQPQWESVEGFERNGSRRLPTSDVDLHAN